MLLQLAIPRWAHGYIPVYARNRPVQNCEKGEKEFRGDKITNSQAERGGNDTTIPKRKRAPFAGYAGNFLCWRNNSFRIFKGPSSQGRSKAVKATDRGSRRGRGRNIQQEFPDEGKMRASWFRH